MTALFGNVIVLLIGLMVFGSLVWKIYKGLQEDKRADKVVSSDPHRAAVVGWLINRNSKNSR